ncbi:MAG: NAD-dependent epimerase/dehydratase family protein [Bacteroidia bacterium]|nr:NAD-dependent epimerase/dehydratase family protein [Bacteroidia bacterium]
MKVAVIGSNGFIGRNLVERLANENGVQLFLFGRSEHSHFANNYPYKKINFSDREQLLADFKGMDLVYHLASETIPATSWENPGIEIEKNLVPFINLLEVIAQLKVKKIAFVSSAGTVYGPSNNKVHEESHKQPFSPYGIMKLTMENFLNYYQAKYGLHFDIYRVSNVYGEGQDTGKGLGIINTFLEKILKENKVKVFGDGKNTRNYIYVKDVAELFCWSLMSPETSGTYNVSSNSTLSINGLIDVMKQEVTENFEVNYEPVRQSDNSFIDLDNTKLLSRFGNFKFTDIHQGIAKTYKALKNKNSN